MHGDEHQQVKQQDQWQREMWDTQDHVIYTVTGLPVAGSSRELIGQGGANGMAGWGLRVTWAAGEAERRSKALHTHRSVSLSGTIR